jgi:hypothetical protein
MRSLSNGFAAAGWSGASWWGSRREQMKSFAVCLSKHRRPCLVYMLLAFGVGISVGPLQGQTMSFFRQFSAPEMDRAS